jgi:Putative beta-barrel porin-2, OmpL-like. bbp2
MLRFSIILCLLLLDQAGFSQIDSTKSPLQIGGYIETYYNFDFCKPSNHLRPSFIYSHNRHNEVNLNLGFIKANYQTGNVRANFALAAGTYMNANYSAEPGVLRNIYEANAGIKISKSKNLWIDAGIFPSHIGFESAIGKDCWSLTRSILAENSPYFESGAKLNYTSDDEKLFLNGLVLNGWQRIQRIGGNNTPAFGHQITYKPNAKWTINSSSFIGNDKPDSIKQNRYFHNFFVQFQAADKLGFIFGYDIGIEQTAKGSSKYNTWSSPVIIAKITTSTKSFLAARIENYTDKKGVIINTGTPNGFITYGYSLNYDYLISENAMWRVEVKGFSGKDKTFSDGNIPTNTNFSLATSLAISF